MISLHDALAFLPHQPPLRLVDSIIRYDANNRLLASFRPAALQLDIGFSHYPGSLLLEGLAQAAVLLTQLESRPLHFNEVPFLGSVEGEVVDAAGWDDTVYYDVKPIKILENRAIIQGKIYMDPFCWGPAVASATFGMVIVSTEHLNHQHRSPL